MLAVGAGVFAAARHENNPPFTKAKFFGRNRF
jgi:hypothetical protein